MSSEIATTPEVAVDILSFDSGMNAVNSEDQNLPVAEKDGIDADQQISLAPKPPMEDALEFHHSTKPPSPAQSFPSLDPPTGVLSWRKMAAVMMRNFHRKNLNMRKN